MSGEEDITNVAQVPLHHRSPSHSPLPHSFFSYLAPLLSFDHSVANKYEQSSRLTTTQSKPRYAITKDGHRQFTCTSWFTMSDENTFPTLSPTLPSPQFSLSFLPPPPHSFLSISPLPISPPHSLQGPCDLGLAAALPTWPCCCALKSCAPGDIGQSTSNSEYTCTNLKEHNKIPSM